MWGALSLRVEINLANSNAITKINNVIYMYSIAVIIKGWTNALLGPTLPTSTKMKHTESAIT